MTLVQRSVLGNLPDGRVGADAQLADGVVVVEETVGVERHQVMENVQIVHHADHVAFLRGREREMPR